MNRLRPYNFVGVTGLFSFNAAELMNCLHCVVSTLLLYSIIQSFKLLVVRFAHIVIKSKNSLLNKTYKLIFFFGALVTANLGSCEVVV